MDVRRGPEEEEALLEFLYKTGVPAMLVATKLDRLPKNQQKVALSKLRKETGIDVIGTSSVTGEGLTELLTAIAKACGVL